MHSGKTLGDVVATGGGYTLNLLDPATLSFKASFSISDSL